jgi:hypothetical protein
MRFLYIAAIVVTAVVSLGPAQFPAPGPPAKDDCGCTVPKAITLTLTELNACARVNGKQATLRKTFVTQGGAPTWQGTLNEVWGVSSVSFYCGKKTGHAGYVASIDFGGQIVLVPLTGVCSPLALTGDVTQAVPAAYARYNDGGLKVFCGQNAAPSLRVAVN